MDWYYYKREGDHKEHWHWHDEKERKIAKGEKDGDGKMIYKTVKGEKAVILVYGSMNESLYDDGTIAVGALIIVLGPKGAQDVSSYTGYSMSSNFEKYGAIADGDYLATLVDKRPGSSSSIMRETSHFLLSNLNGGGILNTIDGNRNPGGYSSTQKDGIGFHATLDAVKSKLPGGYVKGGVSTGCLLIDARILSSMVNQLKALRNAPVLLQLRWDK